MYILIWLLIPLSNYFCELNELYQGKMRDVGDLNSTTANHVMPLTAESDISCKTARFEGASLLRCEYFLRYK